MVRVWLVVSTEVGNAKAAVARRMLERREIATMLNSGEMEHYRARSPSSTLYIDPNTGFNIQVECHNALMTFRFLSGT